jgi:hypothetical protein
MDLDGLFFLVPDGNGYYSPRYPAPSFSQNTEMPGISLAEADFQIIQAINKLRSLSNVSKVDWKI